MAATVLAAGGLGALVAYSLHPGTPQPGHRPSRAHRSPAHARASGRSWIMGQRVLDAMAAGRGARRALAHDTVYLIPNGVFGLPPGTRGLHIVRTAYFSSEARLARAVRGGTLPRGTRALLYDNEPWSRTPARERAHPVTYYRRAFDIARAHGYLLIATPVPAALVPRVARYADVLDVQAQAAQASTAAYASQVRRAARAAAAANPKVVVLAGLSTNPRAGVPTPARLVADARSVSGAVRGFWLNVPRAPPVCRRHRRLKGGRCSGPQPQVGRDFLARLGPR